MLRFCALLFITSSFVAALVSGQWQPGWDALGAGHLPDPTLVLGIDYHAWNNPCGGQVMGCFQRCPVWTPYTALWRRGRCLPLACCFLWGPFGCAPWWPGRWVFCARWLWRLCADGRGLKSGPAGEHLWRGGGGRHLLCRVDHRHGRWRRAQPDLRRWDGAVCGGLLCRGGRHWEARGGAGG